MLFHGQSIGHTDKPGKLKPCRWDVYVGSTVSHSLEEVVESAMVLW